MHFSYNQLTICRQIMGMLFGEYPDEYVTRIALKESVSFTYDMLVDTATVLHFWKMIDDDTFYKVLGYALAFRQDREPRKPSDE